ncbi:hypothetical protein ACRAWD_03155 [Caulobacter segnis]
MDIASQAGSQVINTPIPYVNPLSGSGNRPAGQCFSSLPSRSDRLCGDQPAQRLPAAQPGLGPVRAGPEAPGHDRRAAMASDRQDRRDPGLGPPRSSTRTAPTTPCRTPR